MISTPPLYTRKPKRRFVRYCRRCGWGFTANQLANTKFCPRCGTRTPRGANPSGRSFHKREKTVRPASRFTTSFVEHGPPVFRQGGHNSNHASRGKHRQVGGDCRSDRKADHPLIGKLTKIPPKKHSGRAVAAYATRHPMTVGAGAAFVGAGLVCAAPAMAVAGAAVAAAGASISTAGALIGCIGGVAAGVAGSPEGIVVGAGIAACGLVLGGMVAFAGGLVLASGGLMAIGGTALAYGGGALALGAGAKHLYSWENANGHLGRATAKLCNGLKRLLPGRRAGNGYLEHSL
jgi:hypothetical protein